MTNSDHERRVRLGKMAESIRVGLWTEALRLAYDYDMARTFDDACGLFADDLAALPATSNPSGERVSPEAGETAGTFAEGWSAAVADIVARAEKCAAIYGNSTGRVNQGSASALRQFAYDMKALSPSTERRLPCSVSGLSTFPPSENLPTSKGGWALSASI